MNDQMKRLLAEKERQDRELAQVEEQLRALGDIGVVVPPSFFEELEALCSTRPAAAAVTPPSAFGLRA